jgi:hypothetical protein
LVALLFVRDLLLRAKLLFVAARNVWTAVSRGEQTSSVGRPPKYRNQEPEMMTGTRYKAACKYLGNLNI